MTEHPKDVLSMVQAPPRLLPGPNTNETLGGASGLGRRGVCLVAAGWCNSRLSRCAFRVETSGALECVFSLVISHSLLSVYP